MNNNKAGTLFLFRMGKDKRFFNTRKNIFFGFKMWVKIIFLER